ncbi:hypothetical protein [Vallicoccus soli]|uniref:Uncharacterized protein n=1 Tax=Vallicoccus soli TaxID=2339232 RepID=A0A3A3Z0J9_9ACTN|nr:hypothetical protein [Vallicoccus soli]RJK95916.1 hypothetical protein D5H78_09960 [Vallicoccus soli]
MTYEETTGRLAAAVNDLLVAGATPPRRPLRVGEAAHHLMARDALVGATRELAAAAIGVRRQSVARLTAQHVVSNPAHVVHDALCSLPRGAVPARPPSELFAAEDAWSRCARASAELELHLDGVRRLPASGAWRVLRDVAALARTIGVLDEDLAVRLPPQLVSAERSLRCGAPHRLLRVAALELADQTDGLPERAGLRERSTAPPHVTLLRALKDVPEGLSRLAAVLDRVGPDFSALDLRATVRVAALALPLVADALPHSAQAQVARGLQAVLTDRLATLGPRDLRVQALSTELATQLRHSSRQVDDPTAQPAARQLLVLLQAARSAARSAAEAGRFYSSPNDGQARRSPHRLWCSVSSADAHARPFLVGLNQACRALTSAAKLEAQEGLALGTPLARLELSRPASPVRPPTPAGSAHPAVLVTPSRRRAPR